MKDMIRIYGYGEDALTLWAVKHKTPELLDKFGDKTPVKDCVVFYRPSFGRSGGKGSSEFGEFDAIIASREAVYLVESKWDNLSSKRKKEIRIRKEQELRHRMFSWYLTHWNTKYMGKWTEFSKDLSDDFSKRFPDRSIPYQNKLLSKNIEYIVKTILTTCEEVRTEYQEHSTILLSRHKYTASDTDCTTIRDVCSRL